MNSSVLFQQLGPQSTQVSLLLKLGQAKHDPEIWSRFVHLYGPPVIHWCKAKGLQHADAHDVTQEVLIRFWKSASRFQYSPGQGFRQYFRSLAKSVWLDWQAQENKNFGAADGDSKVGQILESIPARDDLMARLEQAFDQEIFETAMRLVRKRVEPQTWEAFRLLALEGQSGKEAAAALGMKVGTVIAARCDVQRMIKQTIQRIEHADTIKDGNQGV